MTQQNAALVEEAASASESMEEQAKGMMRLMEFFNLGDAGQVKQEPVSPSRNLGHSSVKPAAQRTRPAAPKQQATDADDSEWDEF
jgi:methyl-accepting chemotaxis protein